jgi:hypothetical protein
VIMLKKNAHGRYLKKDVLRAGYDIVSYGMTYTQLKDFLRDSGIHINWTDEERIKYCFAFRCEPAWRGCVPVYDLLDVMQRLGKKA